MVNSRQLRRLVILLVVAVFVFTIPQLAGCGTSDTSSDTIKIGAVFAISGSNSPLGTPQRDTVKVVEEQINAKGGINGKKVQVIVADSESDETKALAQIKKLIEQDKVLAIIGPSSTGESLAVIETVEKAGVPLISCAASAQIVDPIKKWVFKTAQSDVHAVNAIYDYLKKKGLTKVALLTSKGGFGTTGKAALESAAKTAGISIVAAESFDDKDLDMTTQLTKIKGTDSQVVIVWGTNPAPAIIARNMKQLSMTTPLVMSHGVANAKFIEQAGDAANGIVLPAGKLIAYDTLPDSDPQKALLADYAKAFQTKYGRDADSFGGYAYDALSLVFKAVETGGADRAKIRDAIEKTTGLVGISGVFKMSATDHNGLDQSSLAMIKIVDGKWKQAD